MTSVQRLRVDAHTFLEVWYDRQHRTWVGQYIDAKTHYQVGNCWYDSQRDNILLFRPEVKRT